MRLKHFFHGYKRKEEILKSPQKFLKKAIRIYGERNHSGPNWHRKMVRRFGNFAFILGLFFYLPSYKRAFRKAFEAVDLKLLQYDEFDLYWSSFYISYDYRGLKLDQRKKALILLQQRYTFDKTKDKACKICSEKDIEKLTFVPQSPEAIIFICQRCKQGLEIFNEDFLLEQALKFVKGEQSHTI